MAESLQNSTTAEAGSPVILEKIVIDKIWSAVFVGYVLLTHGDMQYIAYYDANRRMTVGMRKLPEKTFSKTCLPSKQGWDSHNFISMAVDKEGYIHLSGNMHADPLLYFRSTKPGDISTLTQINCMAGEDEEQCTYPRFMTDPEGQLVFHYRDGSSGNGAEIYNRYDIRTKSWRRLLETPLADGQGKMNAYMWGPVQGPDGDYHTSWVWRDTPDCATNHDLSYARSKDLVHWETVDGSPVTLPMTPEMKELIVDPVPVNGGILNGTGQIGFDTGGKPVLTYHKFDDEGNTQIYTARFEQGAWKIRQLTQWDFRWFFNGVGSIGHDFPNYVSVSAVRPRNDGRLALDYISTLKGNGTWLLDSQSLKPVQTLAPVPNVPSSLTAVTSDFPGMKIHWLEDTGSPRDPNSRYILRWETLGRNRDMQRNGPLPENSQLILYKLGVSAQEVRGEG